MREKDAMKKDQPILQKPLASFSTSEEFSQMCQVNGFTTLDEIIKLQVKEMLRKPEFNLRMLKELYQMLEDNHLEGYLKE